MSRTGANRVWRQATYIGVAFVLGALGLRLSLRRVEWDTVLQTLRTVRPVWLTWGVAGVVGVAVVKAARWYRLFGAQRPGEDWWSLLSILILAQTVNIAVPVRGGGEALRVGLTARRFPVKAVEVGGTLVVEKVVDFLALGLIGLFVMPSASPILEEPTVAWLLWLIGLGGLLAIALLVRFRASVDRWLARWPTGRRLMSDLLSSFSILRSAASVWELTMWTIAVWALSCLSLYAVLQGTHARVPLWGVFALVLFLHVSFLLPTAPGLVGVVQYVCVLVLGFFGFSRGRALGTSIVLHLVLVLPLVLLAVPAWLYVGRKLV